MVWCSPSLWAYTKTFSINESTQCILRFRKKKTWQSSPYHPELENRISYPPKLQIPKHLALQRWFQRSFSTLAQHG
jgi:hypothetical protein